MKRLTVIIALLALFLSACRTNDSSDVVFFTLYGFDEYQSYIAEKGAELPENFIYWEDISLIADGELSCLTFHPNGTYMYHFDDVYKSNLGANHSYSGTSVWVNLTPQSSLWALTPVIDSVSGDGNHIGQVAEYYSYFVYKRGDCCYHYYNTGKLAEIFFKHNGIEFRIKADFDKFPEAYSDTVLGRLLSADEAVANAAFAEITEKLSQ